MAQATLFGQLVDDGGLPCHVWFEWGTDTSYGSKTVVQGSVLVGAIFSATITGLGEGVIYHYRAVAQNAIGISYGQDIAFVTQVPQGIAALMDDAALLQFLEVS